MDEKIVKDDDQSSVGSSSDSSIFSLDSASSGSQSSTDGLLSVVDELVEFLANDEILKPLYRAAVSDQTIGGDFFEVNFRRLLESCSEELKMEAHQQLQGYAVKLLRSRAAYISSRLRALHDPRYDDKEKETRKVHTQRNERLGPEIVEQVNSWSQALVTPDFSNATASRIICPICSKEFKGILQDAKSNLRRHLRTSPRHTREYRLKCPMPECEKKPRMRSDNLGPHLHKIHKISSKSERQSIIRHNREYSLKCPMPECEKKPRMRSDHLGPHLHKIHKISPKSERQSINGHCRQSPPDRATPGPEYELLQVAEEAEEGFRALQSIEQELEPNGDLLDLQSLIDLKEFFLSSDAFISLRTNFRQCMLPAETTVLIGPEPKFLLLCFRKPGDTLRLYHLSVEDIKTDFELFRLLQQKYRTHQGLLGRFFSPRKIKSVKFRKLERHPHERVVIRSCSDVVPRRINPGVCHKDHIPKCNTEYDIDPEPPDFDPYVGPNGLEHLLNHPHEAEEQGNNLPVQDVWLKRFPKKKTKLTVCPPYQYGLGRGIESDETWNFSWVLKGILFGFVLAATVFLVCWWSVRGDVQGATGMAALLVSYCVLLITLFSAFAIA